MARQDPGRGTEAQEAAVCGCQVGWQARLGELESGGGSAGLTRVLGF